MLIMRYYFPFVQSLVCLATAFSFSAIKSNRWASVTNSFALFVLIVFGSKKGFAQIISIDDRKPGKRDYDY